MLATKVDDVYEVELPPAVRAMLSYFAFGVSFGFDGGVGIVLECLDMRGYVQSLALYIVAPLAVALLMFLAALVCTVCSGQGVGVKTLELGTPPVLQLFFLAYPIVTKQAFDAFTCYEFTESEWLKADVAIECDAEAALRLARRRKHFRPVARRVVVEHQGVRPEDRIPALSHLSS